MAEKKQSSTFDIRKIYIKDASLECPNSPEIFLKDLAKPEISIDASIGSKKLEQDGYYEVVLAMTVTSKMASETAFLVEIQQAGVFHIDGIPKNDLPLALEIACSTVLLPFAREAISDLVGKAGFPQLLLSPINFEGLFQQKLKAEADAKSKASTEEKSAEEKTH